ncbi:hypothetical protein Vretimale_9413 [Volvox reticuliferus]|uniref:Exonuclease domain-containing protein n=1 Tax=Volvox reticuliferus TaxID=1737510 RepID=A0A8J4CFR0_9CHLO|nr:hypothetical protein Vretifemale_9867 [Volvox reticuliferus]GIM04973.1 hypothetical protein Vretimale_9413 [Volvox reticuliferus]
MLSPGAFDATFDDLVGLVKASRRHNLLGKSGTWEEFLKKQGQRGGLDPKKHSRDILEAYVKDLLDVGLEGAAASSAAVPARVASSTQDFVERYLKWSKKVRKDAAKGRGVLPPAPPGEPACSDGADSQQDPQQQPEADPSTQQVSVWSLIHRTRAHPKYGTHYGNLPSYSAGWTRVKRSHLSAAVRPRLLALDCEMCATEEDESALLGVCVVDEFGEVLYREIVRPEGRIKDLRTALTGVTSAALVNIKVTAKDAQRAVCKLLEGDGSNGRPVVLVGHALHHDLTALRLDHQPVIDTSLIFSYRNLPSCIPGLKDLARAVLGAEMRKRAGGTHDSMEDAAVAMRLVIRELQMAVPSLPLEPPQVKVPATELVKLMAHALPEGMGPVEAEQALRAALAAAGAPTFERLEVVPDNAKQVLLVFAKPSVANESFKKLPGKPQKDSLGRYFKEVALGSGKRPSCKVRKMACHNGMAFGSVDANTKPAPKRPAKRTRSTEQSIGHEVGAGGEASTGAAQQGFGRKAKRQKRGHGGDEDPVKAAASQPGTTAAAATATAPVTAAMGAAETASVVATDGLGHQHLQQGTKTKKQMRGDGENAQAVQHAPVPAATSSAAAPTANGTANAAGSNHVPPTAAEKGGRGKGGGEGKERKRKRDKEAEGQESDGGVAEGKEGTTKKARKDPR